ncbi:EfeM/EfeO family lipoprotein [Streptomyces sp. NPDC051976]|uniref:EfeM/EfeO family lipoprotein n=1 Tax=Streptomyces sp. NPDC051976 TaxID=3154947 RepID=UPI00342E1378
MSAEPDGIAAPPPRPSRRRRLWQAGAAGVVVAAAVTAALLADNAGNGVKPSGAADANATAPAADGLRHTVVEISTSGCGHGWTRPRPGTQVFDLHNSGADGAEVYLTEPKSGKVYGEVEGLAPGTTRPMTVDLGSGSYAFKCVPEDADAVTGPTVTVGGSQPQGPGALPVTQHDLIPPTLAYQKWIGDRMTELAHGTAVLKTDIDGGDLAAARTDWLTAHLVYERMGAAYGTFGDADGAINGTAARTPGAVADPSFTGFHRIEYGLWHGQSAAALRAPAAKLDSDVRALRTSWAQARMDPADLGLRAHEILENAEQFELTGRTDYGSGTNLATVRANLDGTRQLLDRLRPLLTPRDPGLPRLDAAMDRTRRDLDAAHHGAGWTPLGDLTHTQRQAVNADLGDLLERLASVAALCDVRRTA